MISMLRFILLLCLIATVCAIATNTNETVKRYEPNWASLDTRVSPTWYDKGKIGIFIHWGVWSVPAFRTVWFWNYWLDPNNPNDPTHVVAQYMKRTHKPTFTYADFAKDFTAELYDPNAWTELFEAAGAKYIAFSSKHHDGYCNWPTEYSYSWNSMDVGPKRDIVGELSVAMKKRNTVKFGLYHSYFEWYNPLYVRDKANGFKTQEYVFAKPMPCLYELVNKYQPEFIWSDGDWDANSTYWNSTTFLAWLYNDSPVKDTIIVNDRWGIDAWCKHGDTFNCKDKFNPGVLQPHKWENAMSLDKVAWTYRREATLSVFYTIDELLHELAVTVSCGGNILINISPRQDGTFSIIMEERLRQMGAWLKINGEAIYDTVPWIYQNDTVNGDVWYTQNKPHVYAMILKFPDDHSVYMRSPRMGPQSTVELVGYPGELSFTADPSGASGVTVRLPYLTPSSKLQHVWVLKFSNLINTEKPQKLDHRMINNGVLRGTHGVDFGVHP